MILITKEKIKYNPFSSDETGKYKDITEKNWLINFLHEEVVFSKDLRFKDVFNHLYKEKKTIHLLFRFCMGNVTLDDFLPDMKRKDKSGWLDLECVQIAWRVNPFEKETIDISTEFLGKPKGKDGNRIKGVETGVGLDFCTLASYADLPIRLNKHFIIEQYSVKKKPTLLLKKQRNFVLFDVLHTILDDVTFYGKPKERDKQFKTLNEQLKRIESGEEEMTPHKEVIKKLKRELKKK